MAQDVQPGHIVKVVQSYEWGASDIFQNVWYYKHSGSTAVSAEDVMEGLEAEIAGFAGFITPYQSTSLIYTTYEFYNATLDEPMGVLLDSYDNQGESGVDPLPTQCAALVSFATGVKKAVGRKYLPGLTEGSSVSGGDIVQAAINALIDWATAVVGGVTIDGNAFFAGHVNSKTASWVRWSLPIIDYLVRTQRRRVRGVGR